MPPFFCGFVMPSKLLCCRNQWMDIAALLHFSHEYSLMQILLAFLSNLEGNQLFCPKWPDEYRFWNNRARSGSQTSFSGAF
jgi:hypothetical protein